MDRLKKPKDFLEKLRLTDSDYQDSGMINHIADLLERYNAEQLILHGVIVSFVCDVEEGTHCKEPDIKKTGACRNCGGQAN